MPGTCAWRINRIKRLSEFGTNPGSATATGMNRGQLVIQLLPHKRVLTPNESLAISPEGIVAKIREYAIVGTLAQMPASDRQPKQLIDKLPLTE